MEKISTFVYLFDNLENSNEIIDIDDILQCDNKTNVFLDSINLLEEKPENDTIKNIIDYSKSF